MTFDSVINNANALKTVAIQPGGHLIFRTEINTKLSVVNLLVMDGGELQIGTQANPVAASVVAEINFADQALDTTNDPEQFGNGLIGLGTITMYGSQRTSYMRLAVEPRIGDTTLTLAQPAIGWAQDNKLILPDTRQLQKGVNTGPNFQPACGGR